MSHLEIEAPQWLELLKIRTKGLARKVVDSACILRGELNPEETVQLAWKYLNQQFQAQKKTSHPQAGLNWYRARRAQEASSWYFHALDQR